VDRRDYRVPVTGVARVRTAGGASSCRIENVSAHGALLQRRPDDPHDPHPRDDAEVRMQFAGEGSVKARCRVVRRARDGAFAVVFLDVSETLKDVIQGEVLAYLESVATPSTVVVDLDPERRTRVSADVRRGGGRAIEVSTPLEALGVLQGSRAHVSALLVAEQLTQTGGRELLDFVRDAYPGVRMQMF
jgi:hypothetical protein